MAEKDDIAGIDFLPSKKVHKETEKENALSEVESAGYAKKPESSGISSFYAKAKEKLADYQENQYQKRMMRAQDRVDKLERERAASLLELKGDRLDQEERRLKEEHKQAKRERLKQMLSPLTGAISAFGNLGNRPPQASRRSNIRPNYRNERASYIAGHGAYRLMHEEDSNARKLLFGNNGPSNSSRLLGMGGGNSAKLLFGNGGNSNAARLLFGNDANQSLIGRMSGIRDKAPKRRGSSRTVVIRLKGGRRRRR